MALTKCKECGKEISSKAEQCPHCGVKIPRTSGCAMMALLLIIIGVAASIFSGPSTQPQKSAQPSTLSAPTPTPATPPPPLTEKEIAKQKVDAAARLAADKKVRALANNAFCLEVGRNLRSKERGQPYTAALLGRAGADFDVEAIDYSYIRNRDLRVGMSWCSLFASWGLPEHGNRSTNAHGTRIQFVYGRGRYAYIENNRLTSWQH